MLLLLLSGLVFVSARILEHRDPKVDPLSLDNVVSRIVDSTMDDLRFRLRQAIYALALRQNDEGKPQNIHNYEDWLLKQFLAQVRKQNDSPSSSSAVSTDSHTMSIALETHTVDPLLIRKDNKLVTADLRLLDAVDQPLITMDEESMPFWIVVSCSATVVIFLLVVVVVLLVRRRRRKSCSARLARLPGTLTISAMCLPEHQGPGAFLERLRSEESIWTTAGSFEDTNRRP